jgi:hypothetical protein
MVENFAEGARAIVVITVHKEEEQGLFAAIRSYQRSSQCSSIDEQYEVRSRFWLAPGRVILNGGSFTSVAFLPCQAMCEACERAPHDV